MPVEAALTDAEVLREGLDADGFDAARTQYLQARCNPLFSIKPGRFGLAFGHGHLEEVPGPYYTVWNCATKFRAAAKITVHSRMVMPRLPFEGSRSRDSDSPVRLQTIEANALPTLSGTM